MGVKLSPPLLDGVIPAFYSTDEGIVITIPFSMNRVVNLNQVTGFQVKIKTVQSGMQLASRVVDKNTNQTNEIEFIISKEDKDYNKFKVGQYYKIQIAYIDNDGTIGYYSTVAVAKYTTKPDMSVVHLDKNNLNSHIYSYTGVYDQTGENDDKTERVYSYRFDLYNSKNEIIDSSGDLLHNSENDELGSSEDTYSFAQDLPLGETYRVQYTVITNNGLEVSSPKYRITQKQSIQPDLNAAVEAVLNYDNGYIDVNLKANDITELSSGFFIVVRSCEDSGYTKWEEVYRFSLTAQIATGYLYRDFTVEQGKNYCYGVQQYNKNGLYSNRLLSNIIYADFEDAFLYDGKRQLKIKYNPKISSFKKDLLETKTDTIGGKHPFIFRNGRVYYSEFPISGLISYQMDEENLFLSEADYGLTEKTTNLTGDNIAAERTFKMKVLEWLTNGEPKVFRSPTEGNFIVRLMNSSLAPNDTVGRMLHTFSSTAYEVADFNYASLGELGFITVEDNSIESLQWETIEFAPRGENGQITLATVNTNLLRYYARTIRFDNMMPGDIVSITFDNNVTEEIKIGVTGSYYIDTGMMIKDVRLNTPSTGSMTYSYDYYREPVFNSISDVNIVEVPHHQFIGEHDILTELLYVWDESKLNDKGQPGCWVKNPKLELVDIYRIDVEKRPLQRVESEDGVTDSFLMYEIGNYTNNIGSRPGYPQILFERQYYYDAFNDKKYDGDNEIYEPYILFNGTVVSVNETEEASYLRPGTITELKSGNGVLVNLTYQMGNITYNIEDEALKITNPDHYLYDLGMAINNYNNQFTTLKDLLEQDGTAEEIKEARNNVQSAYKAHILALIEAQEEDSHRKGVVE